MQLEGKVALITGGGTGIGAAIAERFVAEGAKVCITGRRREMLEQVASSLPNGSVTIFVGDVSDESAPGKMVDAALAIDGRLDVLVNNAGVSPANTVVDMELPDWRKAIDTNLTGPFLTMKAAIPHMIEAGGGSIINVASLAGVVAVPGSAGYCASKAGLIHLTKQVAYDFGKDKIRCNVIVPGPVRTPMLEHNFMPMAEILNTDLDDVFGRLPKGVPLRRIAAPSEISGVCVFLAGEDSSFMTGATLIVDGGIHFVDSFAASVGEFAPKWG